MLIHAAWIIPVASPPIRDGFVRVAEGRIVELGPWRSELARGPHVIDLSDAVLKPGLVNPHTHLELTGYHGQLPPGPLWEWLFNLVKFRRQPEQIEREQAFVAAGAKELLRAGVTLVGDISRRNLAWPVLARSPLRAVCFVEVLTLAQEPPRNPAEIIEELERMAAGTLGRVTPGISPHAPYTVSAQGIEAAIQLANERGLPWTAHWAETAQEVAFLAGDSSKLPQFLQAMMRDKIAAPHCRPFEYLAKFLPANPSSAGSLAHGNYLADDEFAALAESGLTVLYCPRAHRFFGHPPHPFERMLAAGVRVAIGTDSKASNTSLAPLEELQYIHREVAPDLSPATLLEMITINAARALGHNKICGTLEPGKSADLAAFQLDRPTDDPVRDLIDEAPQARAVWIAGDCVCEPVLNSVQDNSPNQLFNAG